MLPARYDDDDDEVFLSKTSNIHTVTWYQVFLSNTNNLKTVI